MKKFKKMVAVERVGLFKETIDKLHDYADEVIMYDNSPASDEEMAERIGDADAMLISYTSTAPKAALEKCPNLKYVGMCCSLYSEKSANVDIAYCREKGIKVTGINDYGDKGVAEYAVYQLIQVLHGFGDIKWSKRPEEITDFKVGMLGMGATGRIIADALDHFGADISYFSRSRKPDLEERGMHFMELDELLQKCDAVFCCLTKNIIILGEREFNLMKGKKMIFNTSIAPSHDIEALGKWLDENPEHYFFGDSDLALGDSELLKRKNVVSTGRCSGGTAQADQRLNDKVLENIEEVLKSL